MNLFRLARDGFAIRPRLRAAAPHNRSGLRPSLKHGAALQPLDASTSAGA